MLLDELVLWRLGVEQYHAIAQAGVLDENDRVELMEGLLVDKTSKISPHTYATQPTNDARLRLFAND